MENQTAFELNLAIERWRENLANSPAFRRENLNELESHLRDSVAALQTSGLSAEEAFLVATRRIGQTQQLESEFSKLNRNSIWLGRAMWMLIGIQAWPFFDRLMSGIAGYLFVLGWKIVPHGSPAVGIGWRVFFSALIQLPALVAAVWLAWRVLKNSSKIGQWIGTRLRGRRSFALCCGAASLLVLLLYLLMAFIPAGWYKLSGEMATLPIIDISRVYIMYLRVIGFTILILLLARKQFALEKA